MRYLRIKVQEQENLNYIFAPIYYVEYNFKLKAICFYVGDGMDNIYVDMSFKEYERWLEKNSNNETIISDKIGYVQPFEELEQNGKKMQYVELDEAIREKAKKLNAK